MTTKTDATEKTTEKVIEIGKVFTRDDDITPPNLDNGDPPLLTADEQNMPVEVELIRPIEVDGQEMKSVVIDPSTISSEMMIFHQNQKASESIKAFRWVCHCTQLAEHDVKKMLPSDYRRVATAVGAFT